MQQGLCTAFKVDALAGKTYKIALYLNADISPNTQTYTSTGEITATGYTAGGKTLTISTPATSSGTTAYIGFADISWTSSNIAADGALIYVSGTNRAVAVIDFGGVKRPVAGVFTVKFPVADAKNALIRIE